MKDHRLRFAVLCSCLLVASTVYAQWSSDPSVNLSLSAGTNGNFGPIKNLPLPNNGWYVSWFYQNLNDPPPQTFAIYYQLLDPAGNEKFSHNGILVANIALGQLYDNGFAVDAAGNALFSFIDGRTDPSHPQVTVMKMSNLGQPLWGRSGVTLTASAGSYVGTRIAATTDGNYAVAWTVDDHIVVQKIDANGHAMWPSSNSRAGGIVVGEPGFFYALTDLQAADNGSFILSWTRRGKTMEIPIWLYANKISAGGRRLWGAQALKVYDGDSLQFGASPQFIPDGRGGAVFAWYTNDPLESYVQHILADGTEAFGHNGKVVSTLDYVHLDPAVAFNPATQETFAVWTDATGDQREWGLSAQKFDAAGNRKWTDEGQVIVPLGDELQLMPTTVQSGGGILAFWIAKPDTNPSGTLQAVKLDASGNTACAQFSVAATPASELNPSSGIVPSGLSALTWQDNRGGHWSVYIQNVNPDCTLGEQSRAETNR